MQLIIANAAFVVNLTGLVFAGWSADILSGPVAAFFALAFMTGAYASGMWVFRGKL